MRRVQRAPHSVIDNSALVGFYTDLKSVSRKGVGVRVPPSAPLFFNGLACSQSAGYAITEKLCGDFAGGGSRLAPQNNQFRSPAVLLGNALDGLDETAKLRRRVVCCNPSGALPEYVLAILERNTRCPQSATERMLKIVNADARKSGPVYQTDRRCA